MFRRVERRRGERPRAVFGGTASADDAHVSGRARRVGDVSDVRRFERRRAATRDVCSTAALCARER